ncbi:hypothetical protein PBR31_00061 [Xanthomonas phage PBR31]|uniref:Uncharacterized protein n=1 Tax=Xanthomonas phage PPDBI TaxID=2723911 RepID=A0A6H0X5S8_9CAUD|nr:hypothetical protein [Ralstonia pickettii]NYS09351.1 hypothetical protein [Ralstonia pickettii]QIN95372.1 hypothetical protein PBR31_00061 [Xanthomonas phage PBR31]QIW89420.1 hypothetical protein PPDBI_00061 [Xanthomonas phage PPDBI]
MATTERQEELLESAAAWRASVNSYDTDYAKRLAEVTARNLERQAETGIATCVCCNKPFGQGTLHL